MKKIILSLLFIAYFISAAFAQQPVIIVENSTSTTAYHQLDSALYYAVAGDFVYIPAGSFTCGGGDCIVDKELHIRGFGHHPFNAQATGRTVIDDDVAFVVGGDNSTMSGVYLTGGVIFGMNFSSATQAVDNITISRCNIDGADLAISGSNNTQAENHRFNECIIRDYFNASNVTNLEINNSILGWSPVYALNATISHCVLLNDVFSLNYNVGTTYKDNIILGATASANSTTSNCISINNLFVMNLSDLPSSIIDNNSVFGQNVNNIFVTQSGNDFSYLHDYHLSTGSLGINAASDNTNIGIYGGSAPFKETMMPLQPYVKAKTINPTTDAAGNLQIIFEVDAQNY